MTIEDLLKDEPPKEEEKKPETDVNERGFNYSQAWKERYSKS